MLACSRRTRTLRAAARLSVLLVAGTPVVFASCGARTGLPQGEPCNDAGSMRPCSGRCGSGQQTCEAGYWQTCIVPRASRACRDSCGPGTETCENDTWGSCKVPPLTRLCSNDCGEGSETCAGGRWSRCEVALVALPCESVCGPGEELCQDGRWLPCNAPLPRPPKLSSVVRDFTDEHPDFEIPAAGNRSETGIVEFELGADNKPVYAGSSTTTTSGRANFDQWYRDTPGINLSTPIDLQLEPSQDQPGLFVYDDDTFFPIDGQLSGNQGRSHNYHFTLEASTRFQYVGGEVFRFTGDDDMWVFINGRLAIDLGGIHASLSATVDLDSAAARLGLARGQIYPLHFFFAERHTIESHFKVETSIAEPGSCPELAHVPSAWLHSVAIPYLTRISGDFPTGTPFASFSTGDELMRARLSSFHTSLWGALGLAALACGGRAVTEDNETAGSGGLGGTGEGRAGTGDFGGTGGDLVGTGGNFGGSAGNFGGTAGAFGGTGGNFGGSGGNRPDLHCSDPQPVLGVAGGPTGYVTCKGGFIHRVERRECGSIVPRPDVIAPAVDGGSAECTRDQDCTEAPYGYCSPENRNPPLQPFCSYGCKRDEDCPSASVCLCGTPVGSCVRASCTTDADCGALLCTSSQTTHVCGGTSARDFQCQSPQDACRGGEDCLSRDCQTTDAGRACSNFGWGGCGRPFLVHGELRQALLASGAAGFSDAPVPSTSALDPMLRKALADHWSQNGLMEHASVAAFARFSLQLLELGAPAALLGDAALAMGDEIAHAELCFGLASSYAGCSIEPGPLPMHGVLDEVSFVDIVHTAILEACIGETFAAAEAAEAVEYVRDPEVKAVLERIARDEARHAELGWKFLRWALERADPATHAILTERLANVVERELARPMDSAAPNAAPELLEHGVLTDALRSEVRHAALSELVVPIARALTELGSLRAA